MTLTLVIPGKPMNMNARLHHMAKAKETARLRLEARLEALDQWGSPATPRRALRFPVSVTVQDECRTANLRDSTNALPSVKAIIDGLSDYGLWPDDGPAHVGRITFLPAVKTGRDALVLTIEEAP